jgi:hypothetical protein
MDGQCVVEGTCGYSDQFAADGAMIEYVWKPYTDISVGGFTTATLTAFPTEDNLSTFDMEVDVSACAGSSTMEQCLADAINVELTIQDDLLSPEYENYQTLASTDITWNA